LISSSHPGPSGARSRKVGSHGVMYPGNGARFAPGTAATGERFFRRFNATAHMPTQTARVAPSSLAPTPSDHAKLDLSKVQ
jgi:hypothetical protein